MKLELFFITICVCTFLALLGLTMEILFKDNTEQKVSYMSLQFGYLFAEA